MKYSLCILMLLSFFQKSIFGIEKFNNKQIVLLDDNLDFYVEVEYKLNKDKYVASELPIKGIAAVNLRDRELSINYYPRGNNIQIANELTHYPPLVNLVKDGDVLACRVNIRDIINKMDILLSDIDLIEFRVVDSIFQSERRNNQIYLTADELYTVEYIYSDIFYLRKDDYELYWYN